MPVEKVDTHNLSSREFNHTMTKLISDVGELTASSKYTKEALDELRVDVKKLNEIVLTELNNSKDIVCIKGNIKELDDRVEVLENKAGNIAKSVFVKAAGYAGVLFLGVILTKVFNVIEEIIK